MFPRCEVSGLGCRAGAGGITARVGMFSLTFDFAFEIEQIYR